MKLVKESLSFERGQSPKASMGVGKIAQIKAWLDEMEVANYTINDDFTIDVNKTVILQHRDLKEFPSFIKFGKIEEFFSCSHNRLTSLEGAPKSVKGDFYCYENQLTSLEGAPKSVRGCFDCSDNQLTSLEGSPESVGGTFYCQNNITKFTKKDVREVCKIKRRIYV